MTAPARRTLFWLSGPLVAIALLTFMFSTNGGPGFFFLSLVAVGLFLVAMPLVQLGLLMLHAFDGSCKVIALASFVAIAALVVVLGASGLFSFW